VANKGLISAKVKKSEKECGRRTEKKELSGQDCGAKRVRRMTSVAAKTLNGVYIRRDITLVTESERNRPDKGSSSEKAVQEPE
jgi:hypothetical protein